MVSPIGLSSQPSPTLFSGKHKKKNNKKPELKDAQVQGSDIPAENSNQSKHLKRPETFIISSLGIPIENNSDTIELATPKKLTVKKEENKPLNIKERIETQLNKSSDNIERNANLATTITKLALERPAGEQRETYIQEAISNYRNKLTSKENDDFSHLSFTKGKNSEYEPVGFPENQTPNTETPQPAQNTEDAGQTENVSAPESSTPPSDPPKTNNDNNTNNKNENKESGGILKGWKKTKLATGTALLAGGIALKMTLIGIVPGLIMAGAGAALMGWGLLNCIFNGKKDDAKDDKKEGEQKNNNATNNS